MRVLLFSLSHPLFSTRTLPRMAGFCPSSSSAPRFRLTFHAHFCLCVDSGHEVLVYYNQSGVNGISFGETGLFLTTGVTHNPKGCRQQVLRIYDRMRAQGVHVRCFKANTISGWRVRVLSLCDC